MLGDTESNFGFKISNFPYRPSMKETFTCAGGGGGGGGSQSRSN